MYGNENERTRYLTREGHSVGTYKRSGIEEEDYREGGGRLGKEEKG